MTAPTRRVFTRSETTCSRPIKHRFNAPADATCGLSFLGPDWLKNFEDQRNVDLLHRKRAKHGRHVSLEGALPLCGVLSVTPCRAVGFNALRCSFPEG